MRSTILALLFVAGAAYGQTIQQSPELTIRGMTTSQVDAHMQSMAEAVSKSAPIRSDEATTITGAVYIKPLKTLIYRVRLSASIPAHEAAQSMRPGFCSGRTNIALMSKGVIYQYGVTTPTETYDLIFARKDCP